MEENELIRINNMLDEFSEDWQENMTITLDGSKNATVEYKLNSNDQVTYYKKVPVIGVESFILGMTFGNNIVVDNRNKSKE